MNVESKRTIAWNNSRHAPSWEFNLHCGIEETGSPGIICIVCHQVFRHPAEHGTSSMGKHLLAKAHIAKLNEWTESEVTELTSSTVDETALAILKRQGSRGITIVSSERKIRFDIQVDPYWPKWQTKLSKLVDKDFDISEFHQGRWNRYLMLHQQKTFPSGRNGSVRVDALRQSRQRHPSGGLLRAWRQYPASRCISPSNRRFAVSSCSVGLYEMHTLSFPSFDLTHAFNDFMDLRNCVDPCGQVVSDLLTLILCSTSQVDSWSWHGETERDDLTSCS